MPFSFSTLRRTFQHIKFPARALAVSLCLLFAGLGPTVAVAQTAPASPVSTESASRTAPHTVSTARSSMMVGNLPRNLSIVGMFVSAGPVVKTVIVVLVLASLVTWTVWFAKNLELTGARRSLRRAIAKLSESTSLGDVVGSGNRIVDLLLNEARSELKQSSGLSGVGVNDRIEIRLERVQAAATRQVQAGTNLLASIGATAPFVGLFGTVWGIMGSFIGISQAQTTNLMVVAPGIAEALLATAFGLIAAVPAVVIYNLFARAITGYRGLVGDAATLVLCIAGRDLDRRLEAR